MLTIDDIIKDHKRRGLNVIEWGEIGWQALLSFMDKFGFSFVGDHKFMGIKH